MSALIREIKHAWSRFDLDALEKLEPLYSPEVQFIEPAGEINGREALFQHFRTTCNNLIECQFIFNDSLETCAADRAFLVWSMNFRHKQLGGGNPITTSGTTLLRFGEQIVFHRDWFDLGETVYEHVPLLGSMIRLIKKKMHADLAN